MPNPSSDNRINAPEPDSRKDLRGRSDTAAPKAYEPDDGPITPAQILALRAAADEDLPQGAVLHKICLFP